MSIEVVIFVQVCQCHLNCDRSVWCNVWFKVLK